MIMFYRCLAVFILIAAASGCQYKKGAIYNSKISGDSLLYVILTKGKGRIISEKAAQLKLRHEGKGNACLIKYLSDSANLAEQKGVLLFHSEAPDMANDMLTKGYFGTLTSKRHVIYVLVSYEDFEKNFIRREQ